MPEPLSPLPATPAGPGADETPGSPSGGPEGAGPRRARPPLRWAERALLIVAVVCLGTYAWATLDARLFQALEDRRLEHELAAQNANLARNGEQGPAAPGRLAPLAVKPGEPIGRVDIPRLGVSVILAEGIASRTLRRAVGHIPGTALPGDEGNIGIAGHRDSFFRPLKDIQAGDEVVLTTTRGTHRYVVETTEIVRPTEVGVLAPTDEPTLTLVTCYPFYYVGAAPKRFIVQAREVAAGQPAG